MMRALPFAICFAAAALLTQSSRSDDNLRIHGVVTALNYAVSRTTFSGSASNGRGLWRRVRRGIWKLKNEWALWESVAN
jgi:hypothetical protein